MADYVVVPTANLTVMPDSIGFPEIVLIESAGTANHAVRALGVSAGDTIVVIGTGGLGMQAVRLALARGARVVAVDTDPAARQRCIDAGAHSAFDPADPGLVESIRTASDRTNSPIRIVITP